MNKNMHYKVPFVNIPLQYQDLKKEILKTIAEVLADSDFKGKFRRIGIPEKLGRYVGNADYLRNKYGLTVENIYKRILKGLKEE